ncbi:uncharacterized protein LOC141907429 [Tubulanus polymorphus]|uniref:uncharacterized protein LOC141907429 n=1 Tax=Tubulanus polymorphus TaxID=672921 RepID=UPI003DA4A970
MKFAVFLVFILASLFSHRIQAKPVARFDEDESITPRINSNVSAPSPTNHAANNSPVDLDQTKRTNDMMFILINSKLDELSSEIDEIENKLSRLEIKVQNINDGQLTTSAPANRGGRGNGRGTNWTSGRKPLVPIIPI